MYGRIRINGDARAAEMKHNGSCDKTCGHMLSLMTVPYSQAVQRLLGPM